MVRLLAEDFENYGTDRVLPFGEASQGSRDDLLILDLELY